MLGNASCGSALPLFDAAIRFFDEAIPFCDTAGVFFFFVRADLVFLREPINVKDGFVWLPRVFADFFMFSMPIVSTRGRANLECPL